MSYGKVKITFSGETSFDEECDCWIARCNDTEITTFGNTPEDAYTRMGIALDLWRDTLAQHGILIKRLRELSIRFTVTNGINPFDIRRGTSPATWEREAVTAGN